MDVEARIRQLNTRRTTLLASLNRAQRFLDDYEAGRDALQVQLRLENLDVIWQGLEDAQGELEELETSNESMVRNLNFRSDFEPKLFQIKAGMLSILPPVLTSAHLPTNPPAHTNSGLAGLKLPTIALPEFNGDYQEWLGFHDTFHALIHSNMDVADIQKLHYLRAALKGEASQVIESISISAANYRLAWEALVARYSNEYLLKKRHLQALFETPRMKEESAAALHGLVDEFERHTKVLKQLGEPTDSWSTMLEHLLCTRLHDETLRQWEDNASTIDKPTYTNLVDFLKRRMRVLESISVNHDTIPSLSSSNSASMMRCGASRMPSKYKRPFHTKFSTNAITEELANEGGAASRLGMSMRKFRKLSLQEKLKTINDRRLCFNCLHDSHFVGKCLSKASCRTCQKRHHTLIHPGYAEEFKYRESPREVTNSSQPMFSAQTNVTIAAVTPARTISSYAAGELHPSVTAMHGGRKEHSFMLTVLLIIVDSCGQEHLARALLDCASQPNLISDKMVQMLRLKRKKVNVQLQGAGGIAIRATDSVSTQIRSRKTDFSRDIEFLVLPQVTADLPEQSTSIGHWDIPSDLFLADPNFNKRSGIDMIIGVSHFFACFTSSARIRLAGDLPELVDSVFGWIVAGSGNSPSFPVSPESVQCHVTAICLTTIEQCLERFWQLEELPSPSEYSVEERECEELYTSTVTRDDSGRYMVRLPRHPDFNTMIGNSKPAALRRFKLLEERLKRDSDLREEYHRFMSEYISLGHMRLLNGHDESTTHGFYLPHHPVVKSASTTTKVRVVFDGSARTDTKYSLNDALRVGPVVQDDLLSIILRFRTYPVALVADIEKMYRQVRVHPDDTPYQRILWRFSDSEPINTYELQTVTYGLAPSSFLATRTLQQLAADEGSAYPLAEPVLRKGFYVDDCLGGAQSITEALQLRKELDELLTKGGFFLRKWTSNKLEVLQGLRPDQIGTQSSLTFTPNEAIKTLGIGWEPEADQLRFDSKIDQPTNPPTKRSILSSISQLFDPLGLIAPVVIRGKLLMQDLWLAQCDWDQQVPANITARWNEYYAELPAIAQFRIDRYALLPHCTVQLHTFSDASEAAYGACTYARCVDPDGNVRVQLLAAKSRVAPLKRVTLPRLELCAARVGALLYHHVRNALQIKVSDALFWSDSTVTLQWLQSPPRTWKTFVANRVSEIQTITHGFRWKHVPGKENPADLLSRGMDVINFLKSELWKYGPEWLRKEENMWPMPAPIPQPIESTETRKVVVSVVQAKPSVNEIFTRFSSFNLLVRVTAWCQRFIRNVRRKTRTQPQPGNTIPCLLTTEHLIAAKVLLIRLAQADAFKSELNDLKKHNVVTRRSPIRILSPFLDSNEIIRVGGRLRLSDQSFQVKHPALLPSFHPLTNMIAKHYHLKLLHGGVQLTLAELRQEYWPINGRRTIRSAIRDCFRCTRANPVPAQQSIGQLPTPRITPSRPFAVTGVDYAGPIYLRPPHKRAASPKAYICIFVCFSTKAVHIELVSDLTTTAFLAAFRRFIARRGLPNHVHSDNGKNFEGAKNELHDLYKMLHSKNDAERIQSTLADEGITWHMTPPKAPHFGGLWEAAVKVAKTHLRRQLGSSRLTFEDMATVLAQIESSMNSRPLVPISADAADLSALTPAHFLIGSTMRALPDPDIRSIPVNRLDHFQQIQQLHQQFWYRWRTEYLAEMQKSYKINDANTSILPGRMVVVVDDCQIPLRWPLARIIDVHPGSDGLSRVVSLRTSRGIIKRPIVKICLLPLEDSTKFLPTVGAAEDETNQ